MIYSNIDYHACRGANDCYPQKEEKMAHSWTPNQLQAINKTGRNILVAAAARKWKDNSFSRKNDKQNN